MEALLVHAGSDNSMDQKWSKMFILSLILHLAVFSTIFLVPEHSGPRKIRDIVYEVNLVEMPKGTRAAIGSRTKATKGKGLTVPAKVSPAKRIGRSRKKEEPLTIAKRTVNVKTKKIKPAEASSSKLLDQILAKREERAKEEKKDAVDQSHAKLESKSQETAGTGPIGRFAANGIAMDIYKADIIDWVSSNWSYPVDLLEPDSIRDTYTVVVLRVEKNGTILKTTMIRGSGNAGFDQSVLKAIKRSDPLPPFPEGYRKTHEEIEINFNLSDLKNH